MAAKKRPVEAQPSLAGEVVYLRPVNPDDAVNIQHWVTQLEPQSMTSRPMAFVSAMEAADNLKKKEKSPFEQRFTIVRMHDLAPVGAVSFFDYNPLNRSAELGVLVDPDEHRHGYAFEAMKLLTSYLFQYRGLNKVHAETAAYNEPAWRLLERLGFHRDGVLRSHYFYKGEFHDKFAYSLLQFEVDW